jgi:hypothetical protein
MARDLQGRGEDGTDRPTSSRLWSHGARRAGVRCLTCRSGQSSNTRSLAFVRRRAERTDFVLVDADGSVVLAEDDSRDVLSHVLRADVGVEWNMRGALEVVGVLVVAHFLFGCGWSLSSNDDRRSLW